MDILVPDRSSPRRPGARPHPAEAGIWGLVALCVVVGFGALVGASLRSDRLLVAANAPVIVRSAPAVILPEDSALP
jgi:hypothetical protein